MKKTCLAVLLQRGADGIQRLGLGAVEKAARVDDLFYERPEYPFGVFVALVFIWGMVWGGK